MGIFESVVYILALTIASLFLVFSLDDVICDLYYYAYGKRKLGGGINIKDLDEITPKPIAIFVPAWHEEEVIAKMLAFNISAINYPRSFYHIFVGVYPNDHATKEAVKPLLGQYKNLHLVENVKDGPTNKSDNLNNIYRRLIKFEQKTGMRFSIVVVHDSEDIIHPTSMKLFNYLMPKHAAVQLPVFPLQPLPTIRNFFKYLTSGTYADEFAENHTRGLLARASMGGFVPSAGTGFAISRESLEKLIASANSDAIFNESSLTEDYELSLRMQEIGESVHFFVGSVRRVLNNGKLREEFIATREFFPNTFYTAVKQKTRWIYGITFQSAKIFDAHDLTLAQRYSLFKDWKAKFANLLLLPGYLLFIYIVLATFTSLPNPLKSGFLFWILTLAVTALTIHKQILRAIALKAVYGWRSAIAACFVPPFLPIRFVWGNIINFTATARAWRIWLFGSPKQRAKWDKTDHHYLPLEVLDQYRRKLGDLLLEKDIIAVEELRSVMSEKTSSKTLGEQLVEQNLASGEELLPILGELLKTGFIDIQDGLIDRSLANIFPEHFAREHSVLPLLCWADGVLVASAKPLSDAETSSIAAQTGLRIRVTLASSLDIQRGMNLLYRRTKTYPAGKRRIGELLIEKGLVDEEHLIEAFRVQRVTGKKLGRILVEMNLISEEQLAAVLAQSVNESA